MNTEKNKPLATVQEGKLQIAIWPSESSKYGPSYSFTFRKSYKSGDIWKETDFMDRDDALVLAHMLPKAYDRRAQGRRSSSRYNILAHSILDFERKKAHFSCASSQLCTANEPLAPFSIFTS